MATRLRLTDEALEEIGGELEARLFARQGPRDAQLQRTLETVLAGRLLDQAHDRAGVDAVALFERDRAALRSDRKSTRLNSSHSQNSYAVFCLKKKSQRLSSGPCKGSQRGQPVNHPDPSKTDHL